MITVHLTEYAPRCAKLPLTHPDRWRRYYYDPADAVIRSLLGRLERVPGQVKVRTFDPPIGEVDLVAQIGDLADVPVATLIGVTPEETTEVLAQLAARDWRPANLPENPFA